MVDLANGGRRKNWSASMIGRAAEIAREKSVTIRLEPNGAIVILPFKLSEDDELEKDWGLIP